MLIVILFILAFLLFFLRACGATTSKIDLVAAGLAAWVLAQLLIGYPFDKL